MTSRLYLCRDTGLSPRSPPGSPVTTRISRPPALGRPLGLAVACSGRCGKVFLETRKITSGIAEQHPGRLELLEAVFLVYRRPAWGTTLGSRIHPAPQSTRRRFRRNGVAAEPHPAEDHPGHTRGPHRIRAPARDLRRRGDTQEKLKQASWFDAPVTAGHFRTEAGDEVDRVEGASGFEPVSYPRL
jgi:hypothetical protein